MHPFLVIKTNQFMLYGEIFFFCEPNKHINTLCGQNVELFNLNLVVHKVTARF
jgi:hypothetical protein